jgi:hypothetical protein
MAKLQHWVVAAEKWFTDSGIRVNQLLQNNTLGLS